jgi:HPt (histidine-containing phosphotransfer) domain-containing protein
MTNPLAAADFFVLEAGEALDRLEALVAGEEAPPAADVLRHARVLRGSALMAHQQAIARCAAALETLVRALRDGRRSWDAEVREEVCQALGEFRRLVTRVRDWEESDTVRAGRLASTLESLVGGGGTAEGSRKRGGGELNPGVRAFVAREGALVASALDRAARSLQTAPGDREPLYTVIRRMQSLRGLAELSDLVPLPEILDGIESAIGDLTRLFAPPPGVDEVMGAAAAALTRIARDIAESGRPDPEAEEARHFTDLLLRAFAVERDVVPIESLYPEGEPHPVIPPPSQPQFASPAPLGPLELVSQGEHLRQIADLISHARSATERDLRLYHLVGALRSAGGPSTDPVASALSVFARSTREALAAGVAAQATVELATCLRDAGDLLRSIADTDDRMLVSRRMLDVAYRLDQLRATPEPAVAAATPDAELDVVPIESLAYDAVAEVGIRESEIVPIESLAPDGPPVVPIQQLAPDALISHSGLEASFSTLARLGRERSAPSPSLEGLLGRVTPAPTARPTEEAVSIEILCYRGRAALERAASVRDDLNSKLAHRADLESIRPLIQELLDLVPLALVES